MSDRTQLAIGRNTLNVPRVTKRALEVFVATGVTGMVSLLILLLNNVLTGRGGWLNGFDVWMSFIRRPDILGTMLLTAICTVAFLQWQRDGSGKR
ncbi:MAG TPA: hypothetical protein PKD49_02070 [Hyphomicrobium sp.]|nr:hypothetical protein [Hyphomicrobium sp.]